jgi:hypothetical protein
MNKGLIFVHQICMFENRVPNSQSGRLKISLAQHDSTDGVSDQTTPTNKPLEKTFYVKAFRAILEHFQTHASHLLGTESPADVFLHRMDGNHITFENFLCSNCIQVFSSHSLNSFVG